MSSIGYEGPSQAIEQEYPEYNHHCPLMGGPEYRMNYWLGKCQSRQADTEEKHKHCFGGCKATPQLRLNLAAQHHALVKTDSELRVEIYALIDAGYKNDAIAIEVDRAERTVSEYRREKRLGLR